jgi:hypothetical protein
MYFEDLNRAPNAEIEPISLRTACYARQEDFFEISSKSKLNDRVQVFTIISGELHGKD